MVFSLVTLQVNNLDESINFYSNILGLEVRTRHESGGGGELAMLGIEGQPLVELICQNSAEKHQYSGFSVGFTVPDLDKAMEDMAKLGYPVFRGPVSPNPNVRFAFIKDPNGITVQLLEYPNS